MPTPPQIEPDPTTIGVYLQWARSQKGLELSDVEERTKIRAKYLQALETEDWDVFPGSAYARGFLATYAKLLGLDADALVDEYRRQVETDEPTANLSAYGEPVLEGRRRVGAPNGSRWPFVAAFVAVLIAVIAVIAFVTGSGSDSNEQGTTATAPARGDAAARYDLHRSGQHHRAEAPREDRNDRVPAGRRRPATGRQPDAARPALAWARSARPIFASTSNTGGVVKVKVDGEIQRLAPKKPSSFRVTGTTIKTIPYKGRSCP